MHNYGKKFLALLLTLCMLVGILPMSSLAAENTAEVVGQQLMLGDDLTMHFYVSTQCANATATIQVGGNERASYSLAGMTAGENGYDLSVELAAAEMTEKILLTVNDGTETILTKEYSVQDYAHYLLENNYTDETKSLVKEMLNYGAKAQLYFGHKTDDLANAGYEMETTATIGSEVSSLEISDDLSGMGYYGASMVFKSKIAVRFYFTAKNGTAGYTFTVNGKPYTAQEKNGQYYIEVDNINPDQMNTALAVSVTKDGSSLNLSYSPMDYIVRMYNKDTTSQALKDMLLAANGYFAAAEVFTGVAENRTGSLNLAYRYGTDSLIQVNTNLPSDTPCVNFTASDNGCSIDQSANQYQQFGWVGMDNVDGTIVLTFHFNSAFQADQTYILPVGAIFGFTDGSKYTLDADYTFTFDGSNWSMSAVTPEPEPTEPESTEPEEGSLNFAYRYGTATLIQVNTNLPSDTPCVNFTASENGCSIDESGNTVQWVGWIGMANVDGTIVLTFNFNNAFTAGQSYVLPAGAVFGFTDGNTYTLDADYTFTFDGSDWTMSAVTPEPEPTEPEPSEPEEEGWVFQYRYGTNNLIQVNTALPSTTPCVNFLTTDNGCSIDESANLYKNVAWIGMENVDGTIVLTFHFNDTFEVGQTYFLPAGAVFGFTDGNTYTLTADHTFTWDGSNWTLTTQVPEPAPEQTTVSFAYRYGTASLIQFNTNLPATTTLKDFLATDNGCQITQSGDQQVGYISMANTDGTIVLTFNFNAAFAAGQSYTLAAGSVFAFTDGTSYILDADYTFYWDGSAWGTDPVMTLAYRYGAANLIQFNTNLPSDTPCVNFTAGDNGCNIDQSANLYQNVGWIGMANADGTIVLTFNFNAEFTYGQSYCLPKGAVFGFTDGSSYKLDRDYTFYWDGSAWSETEPVPAVDVLDESNFTGGKDIITFADLPVDSNDPAKIDEYKGLGFNTSLLAEDHTGAQGPDERYTVTMDTANAPENGLNFAYRYGTSTLIQVNTNLPASTPIANFTADQNGCSIDQTGNTVQWVGWIGMANADGTIVLTFNFNSAFTAGQSYVLPKGAVFGFTDGNTYTLDADYTFTWDGSNWSMNASTLNLTLNAGAAKYIQLKTNIPTGLTYGDFLLSDTTHNVILETTEGAQAVGWFSYSELSGAVYLTFNFGGYNKPGTQYILKAGTSLKAGDNVYTTDRDYILTVHNDYLTSLENLDNAGLNVWIRNYHNTADYFTSDLTAGLLLYQNVIDGFYMTDEAFQTNALLTAAGQQAHSTDFESMVVLRDWFNQNFADKYFHVNHVPITSYDHYNDANGNALSAMNTDGYRAFLQSYKTNFNDQLTSASGSSVSFDNYPFIHAQGTYKYGILNLQSKFESGIQSTYLLNGLIAAQVAGEDDFGLCIQTFEATDLTYDVTRDITSSAEVSLQLYTGMALGADLFEYFAYNSNGDFNAIMNQDGSKRIYDIVKEGNEALCFADVVNTFTWNGIVTSTGSVNSHNTEGFSHVENMILTNISNGVLDSYSSTDDAVIGCFTKGDLNGYMVVNFNDPAAVTGNNTVTMTFANCTRARIYTSVDGVLTSQLVDLTNGSCTVTLAPGSGCFIIPA